MNTERENSLYHILNEFTLLPLMSDRTISQQNCSQQTQILSGRQLPVADETDECLNIAWFV